MKLSLVPKTKIGKYAVGLGFALTVFTTISLIFAFAIGGESTVIDGSFFLLVLANMLSILFSLAGPLSFLFGIFAIFKYRDWPVLLSLTVLYALAALIFLIGEFTFPH